MLVLLLAFGLVACALPFARRWIHNGIFIAGALMSAVAFVVTLFQGPTVLAGGEIRESVPWLPYISMNLDLRVDALSWIMALIVTGVGALVLLYCARYFRRDEPDLGRFAAILLAFAGVMYGLVVADNFYLQFIFWELTSVFSYLLVGHYTGRRASRGAALQALMVTTFGGLAMLVGIVMLHARTGTALLSEIIAAPPAFDGLMITAVMLVLVGVATKSALVPFHFWLPGAMAAPTPVSAYLHAAAMVKAGIYLVARLAPGFADMPGWREVLITVGVATMLVGGWRALRQFDLKLILAYGTVSQLGFITAVVSFGTRDAALAGMALVIAHACFKAALFLIVGMIDHRTGTRDIRKLSGLGRSAPLLVVITTIALASMSGLPPLIGFVAKEGVLTAFLQSAQLGDGWGWVALIGAAVGSVLTVAYSLRFLWGAYSRKPGVESVQYVPEHLDFMASPALLALASIVLGLAAPILDGIIAPYADTLRALDPEHPAYLALWHGFEPALFISLGSIALGVLLFVFRNGVSRLQARVPAVIESARGYWVAINVIDIVSARVTAATQRGSLPFYLGTIIVVFVVSTVGALLAVDEWPALPTFSWSWVQLVIVIIMSIAAVAGTRSRKRFQAVVLVGVTGYGLAAIFALHGAPDLALTQALIETVTLVVFVLVLRRLPAKQFERPLKIPPAWLRWGIGFAVGLTLGALAVFALASRTATPDSAAFPLLAFEGGHGENIVNVTLVDLRGWDTMGELSVLIAAATGIASLIYLNTRNVERATPKHVEKPVFRLTASPITDAIQLPHAHPAKAQPGHRSAGHQKAWLLAGRSLAPENRSIILEVVVRLVFHALFIVSLYLLFSGHNEPGGGFAGGIVAGLALTARYLAGGRHELNLAMRIDAGRLLGIGLLFATVSALVPVLLGFGPLTSAYIDEQIPYVGQFVFVTSTMFDIGVYLVCIALIIDILRSLGSEIDIQAERSSSDEGSASDDGELQVTALGNVHDHPVATRARAHGARASKAAGRRDRDGGVV